MMTQLKNPRNNFSWKRWCLNTSFSHSKLRWIHDTLVCLHARYCSEFHGSFCVFAPQGCKLSRAAPQMSYFYLFVLNTHTRPWNAFTGTSKCSRIWKRLLSPDVGTTSTDADVSPRAETYPPYCSTHPSVLKCYLKDNCLFSWKCFKKKNTAVLILDFCITKNLKYKVKS